MKKYTCITVLAMLLGLCATAQEVQVKSFQKLERDLTARTHERLDRNDEPCAVVRVSVPKARHFVFEGNVIGQVEYLPGEALVYMSSGTRRITIQSEEFGTLRYEFPYRLTKHAVYKLELNLILNEDKKIRTLVMPVAGIGKVPSYGIMLGIVKRAGAYLKVKSNLKSASADYKCDANGVLEGYDSPSFFTGRKQDARLAVTGGALLRVSRPVYLYAGGGYGYKKLNWELADSTFAENTDESYTGAEAEAGALYRLKNFAFSAGVQTNSFKYWEATVGFGIMF